MPDDKRLMQPTGGMRRRMIGGGLWVILNRVLVALTQVLSLAILTRLLSPGDMGVYFIISNFVVVASILVQMGLPTVVVKRSAESLESGDPDKVRAGIQACLLLGLAASGLFTILFMGGVGKWLAEEVFSSPLFAAVLLPVCLWVVIQAVQRVVGEAFRGLHDMRLSAIFGGMFSGIASSLFLIAIALTKGSCTLEQAILAFVWAVSLSFITALVLLHRKTSLFSRFGASNIKPILQLAIPMLFTSLANIILTRADIWILGMYVDDADVALYGAAARIALLLGTPLLIATAILSGTIAQLNFREDKKRLQELVQLVPTVLAVPAFVMIALCVFLGDELLLLIYGSDYYRAAWPILNILAFGQLACLCAGVSIQVLIMTSSQVPVLLVTLFWTVFAIGASVMTVDSHGIIGVATAFAIGTGMQSVSCLIICKARLGINTSISLHSLLAAKTSLATLREQRKRRN